jgi:diadenosine tetraphosphate (Ap4A) HIT family hydrolase
MKSHLNTYSHLTAKERDTLSFPANLMWKKGKLTGDVLDFGCGLGKDVELLKEKGINIAGYDKHYFPKYPSQKYDTIICFYVLNVLLPEEQAQVLMQISHLLKPGGKAFFAVRRDIKHEGFRTHKIFHKPTFQCIVRLNYKSVFKNENCEIYEYKHFNQIARKENLDCPFCNPEIERKIIVESATAYSIYDKFPVNVGHALIIPKKHIADYFQLTFKEQSACWFMLNTVKNIIAKEYKPTGYNVGININVSGGQTVSHVHIHIIPRYDGDVSNPVGGVRNVIPLKGDYREMIEN